MVSFDNSNLHLFNLLIFIERWTLKVKVQVVYSAYCVIYVVVINWQQVLTVITMIVLWYQCICIVSLLLCGWLISTVSHAVTWLVTVMCLLGTMISWMIALMDCSGKRSVDQGLHRGMLIILESGQFSYVIDNKVQWIVNLSELSCSRQSWVWQSIISCRTAFKDFCPHHFSELIIFLYLVFS